MDTMVLEKPVLATRALRDMPIPRTRYPFGHPGDECPACRSGTTRWIANENSQYNYLCEACGRCWSLGPAGATRVNPLSCRDCDHREACLERLRTELAGSWWLSSGQ